MVATQYSTLLGFSLKPSFHRCEMIEMAEQSLADIFCPSIMTKKSTSTWSSYYGNSPMSRVHNILVHTLCERRGPRGKRVCMKVLGYA